MNPFIGEKKKYKFQGLFDSDKSEKEIDNILDNLGFYMFNYEERDKPNPLKRGSMGRPLKYSKETMKAVVNREKTDKEFAENLGKSTSTIRNARALWRRKYPELEVKKC